MIGQSFNDTQLMIMILNLYSAFSIYIYSNALYKYVIYEQRPDQTTTPGTTCPTLDECVGSLTSPASHYSEGAGDGAYDLSSLSEKTRISNLLQMSLQRQHILLSK